LKPSGADEGDPVTLSRSRDMLTVDGDDPEPVERTRWTDDAARIDCAHPSRSAQSSGGCCPQHAQHKPRPGRRLRPGAPDGRARPRGVLRHPLARAPNTSHDDLRGCGDIGQPRPPTSSSARTRRGRSGGVGPALSRGRGSGHPRSLRARPDPAGRRAGRGRAPTRSWWRMSSAICSTTRSVTAARRVRSRSSWRCQTARWRSA
jgi:hypothetical protein